MNLHGNRTRLGGALVAAAAALALLALPGLASSHSRDHDPAGDAGTIQSFDPASGVLAIDLTAGGSVSGLVTPRTHIRCGEDEHGRHHRRGGVARLSHRDGSDDGAEDEHQGRGNEEEHGGRAEEPGEDTPGHDGTAPGSSEDPGRGAEHSHRCTTDDLVAGATVKFAELVLVNGNAFYGLVGLEPTPEETPAT